MDESLRALEREATAEDFDAFRRWNAARLRAGLAGPGEAPADLLARAIRVLARQHAAAQRRHERWGEHIPHEEGMRERYLNHRSTAYWFQFMRLFRAWLRAAGRRAEWDALTSFVLIRPSGGAGAPASPTTYVPDARGSTAEHFAPINDPLVIDLVNIYVHNTASARGLLVHRTERRRRSQRNFEASRPAWREVLAGDPPGQGYCQVCGDQLAAYGPHDACLRRWCAA